jgi:YD repeat-containing protein
MLELRSSNGQTVGIERDRRRNLRRLIAPNQGSINFDYDSRYRIIKAFDDKGKVVKYAYDAVGRLIEVHGAGSTQRFDYDEEHLTAVHENGHRLLDLRFPRGTAEQISLPDGRTYKIRHDRHPEDKSNLLRTYLTFPDGTVHKFELKPK